MDTVTRDLVQLRASNRRCEYCQFASNRGTVQARHGRSAPQREELECEIGGEDRRYPRMIKRWRDLDQVEADEIQSLPVRAGICNTCWLEKAADFGRSRTGREGRVQCVNVE